MKRRITLIGFIMIIAILFASCSPNDYSNYKSEKGYTDYISTSTSGCEDLNTFGIDCNLESKKAQEYYNNNVRECDDFLITNYLDGICINRYVGFGKTVEIPETLDGKPVIMLGDFICDEKYNGRTVFYGAFGGIDDCKIKIPSTVKYISCKCLRIFSGMVDDISEKYGNNFQSIEIDDNNPYYFSENNTIYSKDGKTLVYIVDYTGEDDIKVSDTVENFEPLNPLVDMSYKLIFGENIKKIDACVDMYEDGVTPLDPEVSGNLKPRVVVRCPKGSVAKEWADKHGLYCFYLDED